MIILGSTGSIGTQAIHIAYKFNLEIEVLCAGENIDLLNSQLKQCNPKIIVIKDYKKAKLVNKKPNQKLLFAEEGILEALNLAKSKLVLNALVGFSGLKPSLESIKLNKKLALANKESLVVAGFLMKSSKIIPVDSEHFALKELLKDNKHIKKLIITASGGALRNIPIKDLHSQTKEVALKHPNWNMGKKITIDSATMANKLLEVLEAKYLFNTNKIDALIEKNSIIHALIHTKDNALIAHLATNDMKLPISYALLNKKAKYKPSIKELDLLNYNFSFEKIDTERYPLWNLKNELLKKPKLGIILNTSNEILVDKFLNNKIKFGEISSGIFKAIEYFSPQIKHIHTINDIVSFDREIRNFTLA